MTEYRTANDVLKDLAKHYMKLGKYFAELQRMLKGGVKNGKD